MRKCRLWLSHSLEPTLVVTPGILPRFGADEVLRYFHRPILALHVSFSPF